MIYWIENIKDGSYVAGAGSYEEALAIQDQKWKEEGIDTYIRKEYQEVYIDHADIVVTHSCPNHCKFCIDKFINTSDSVVSLDSIKQFLQTLSRYAEPGTEILLLGGEPTVVGIEYLKEICSVIRSFNFSPIISTNIRKKSLWYELIKIFDWTQITVHTKEDIEFLKSYIDKANIKIAGDKSFTYSKMLQFIEDTRGFQRRSVSMYFTPDFHELCEDKEVWDLLNTLKWLRNGSYMYAFYNGVRFKRCIPGETNIIDEPTVPKLYPNGNYNKTWCNEFSDNYLDYEVH